MGFLNPFLPRVKGDCVDPAGCKKHFYPSKCIGNGFALFLTRAACILSSIKCVRLGFAKPVDLFGGKAPLGDFSTVCRTSFTGVRFFLRKCAVYNRFCGFNIHRRWSIAHLYQAVLNGEERVKDIAHINTLAGYIHYQLTGKRQVGIGEASGIFPVDGIGYNAEYIAKVDEKLAEKGFSGKLAEVLPGCSTQVQGKPR